MNYSLFVPGLFDFLLATVCEMTRFAHPNWGLLQYLILSSSANVVKSADLNNKSSGCVRCDFPWHTSHHWFAPEALLGHNARARCATKNHTSHKSPPHPNASPRLAAEKVTGLPLPGQSEFPSLPGQSEPHLCAQPAISAPFYLIRVPMYGRNVKIAATDMQLHRSDCYSHLLTATIRSSGKLSNWYWPQLSSLCRRCCRRAGW